MSEQTDPLPPVPDHTPPTGAGDKVFDIGWLRWFLAVRTKVNVLSASLVNLAHIVTVGILSSDGIGGWVTRTITGTAGNISVNNGNGVAGNPTIDMISTAVTPGS